MSFPIPLNQIKSLCILRLSAIGDVTHVLPLLNAIQQQAPQIKITWVIGKIEHKLLKGLKGVEFIIFNKNLGLKAYKKLKKDLKHQKFDALLQMQLSFRANLAAQMIATKYRIGFDKKRSKELHSFRLTHRIAAVEKQHVLDSFYEFAKVLGIKKQKPEWNITYSQDDEEQALKWIKKDTINVIISPCSSHPSKNWKTDRYAEICDYLVEKYNAQVLLCGGPSEFEQQISAEIESLCRHPLTNITGKDTLKQLFVLMKNVNLVISPDSGPAHIANAAGTQVIALHATTTAKRCGPYLNQHLAIDVFQKAAWEIAKKDPESIRWGSQIRLPGVMDLISTDSVIEKIDYVLGA